MTDHRYPDLRATASASDVDDAELVQDYDMSDPERTKIRPLKSARERCALFERLAAAEM